MSTSIKVSDNIKECLDILDNFIRRKDVPADEDTQNALKYLRLTVDNASKGEFEPRGCPRTTRLEKV